MFHVIQETSHRAAVGSWKKNHAEKISWTVKKKLRLDMTWRVIISMRIVRHQKRKCEIKSKKKLSSWTVTLLRGYTQWAPWLLRLLNMWYSHSQSVVHLLIGLVSVTTGADNFNVIIYKRWNVRNSLTMSIKDGELEINTQTSYQPIQD